MFLTLLLVNWFSGLAQVLYYIKLYTVLYCVNSIVLIVFLMYIVIQYHIVHRPCMLCSSR